MLGVLRLGFGGHRNGDGVRLIVITGEEPAVVDLLQLHAVVVDHAVGGDRAAAAFDEPPCGFLAVQRVQFIHTCAAAVQVHVVVAADRGEVGKVGDDRGLLAAEGQVDEILQLEQLQLVGHRLKLRGLAGVEAVQPFGEVVQLLHIDREHLRSLEDGVEAVDLLHLAVRLDRVADLQRLQQLHAVRVLVAGNGERDGRHAVFRVMRIAKHRLYHHVSSTPFSKFKTTSPYLAISSAPSDQVERLICDQFRRRKVCQRNIAAADRNGLRRLVDAVEFRLDPSETDALKVKAVVPAFPDHPAPKALVCREQEEGRFVPVRQTPAAFPPVCPSSPVGIGQEELRVSFSELLMHPFSELRPHRGCEAVPHELIQIQYTCLDPFIQAGTFT